MTDPAPPSSPAAEFVANDKAAAVLFTAMQTFWQGYYACHTALLDLAIQRGLKGDLPQLVADYAAGAARRAAQQEEKPTVEMLEQQLRELCVPVIAALASTQKQTSDEHS